MISGKIKRRLLSRIDAEVEAGRLWRVKEILRGNIASHGYDLDLFERHGQVLLALGDNLEAGKFLLLSAPEKPDHRDAVELFVMRHARKDVMNLYRAFPKCARLRQRNDYPDHVATELERLGLPWKLAEDRSAHSSHAPGKLTRTAITSGCLLAIVMAILVFIAGIGAILRVIFR